MARLPPGMEAEEACDRLEREWQKEVRHGSPNMERVLFRVYRTTWLLAGAARFTSDVAQAFSPLLLNLLLVYLGGDDSLRRTRPASYGYLLVLAMFALQLLSTILNNVFFVTAGKVGMRLRMGLAAALYRKTLRLSLAARKDLNVGKLNNIFLADTSRIDKVVPQLHMLWAAPVQIIVVLVLLIRMLHVAALAGVAVMLAFMFANSMVMRKLFALRKATVKLTDQRVRLLSETLQGIKIIKLFAWESSFLSDIGDVRDKELVLVRKFTVLFAAINGLSLVVPSCAAILVFLVYSANGTELSVPLVFSSLALFNVLRQPLMQMPMIFGFAVDARVAAKRLGDLFQATEVSSQPTNEPNDDVAVEMSDASFTWDSVPVAASPMDKAKAGSTESQGKGLLQSQSDSVATEQEQATLRNVNLRIPKGSLVAVCGRVGSGKSSLLSGIIGEMPRVGGRVNVDGTVSYCSQQPWIMNATLKDNILFGQSLDQARYDRALFYASLHQDLDSLPAGDLTEIGEKGVNLSGGQKARVSLARALYVGADVVVMDDVLSAVDAHVGAFLFTSTLRHALAGKTRILATHALHCLPQCDYIVLMNDGHIELAGTYSELMSASTSFSRMMHEYSGGAAYADAQDGDDIGGGGGGNSTTSGQVRTYEMYINEQKPAGATLPGDKDKAPAGSKLMTAEERATGVVDRRVYAAYGRACGGVLVVLFVLIVSVVSQLVRVFTDLWLTWWTEDKFGMPTKQYVLVYFALGVGQAIAFTANSAQFSVVGVRAARRLHAAAVKRIVYSPMSFFDTTPLGRIISRFSRDQDLIDTMLHDGFRGLLISALTALSTLVLIVVVTPWFAAPLVPLLALYYYVQTFYRATSRELKRLDSVARSPMVAHYSETLAGIVTIRAYKKEQHFSAVNKRHIEFYGQPNFQLMVAPRWLAVRLETIGNLLILGAGLLGVSAVQTGSRSSALFGLSMSYALQVTSVLNLAVRQSAEVENNMNCVERLDHYASHIEPEAAAITEEHHRLPEQWPTAGHIQIENVELAYRPGLAPVLHNLNLDIPGGSKVGIVGRTGAGKSSIIVALLRLVEASQGCIKIDGVDIRTIGLGDLRKRIGIIPQDPVLFAGTIRSNLDRFGKHSDGRLWEILEHAGLRDYVAALDLKLDAPVAERGENMSVGQRQLMCLARAMVVQARILIMDEATASVDHETDMLIQRAIRDGFASATVITVAHRLNTIIDYDRIVVMDGGQVKEYDQPVVLLGRDASLLTKLVNETGATNAEMLRRLAQEASSSSRPVDQ
ncbi:hypothetical protein RI367_000299 [Sorochytrium milnesiophthora]